MTPSAPAFPDAAALETLRADLAALRDRTDAEGPWQGGAFRVLAERGILAGFVPADAGGSDAAEDTLQGALAVVAEGCLTTALALTQWASACRIIATGPAELRSRLLPALARGSTTTTVGIAQLTTSRQHSGAPALRATWREGGWRLDGECPWVTGAGCVDSIVTGAVCDGGDPRFFVVASGTPGLSVDPPMRLLALSASRTARVAFDGVAPVAVVDPGGPPGARAGGSATIALAIGAARSSLAILRAEAGRRGELGAAADRFAADIAEVAAGLGAMSRSATPAVAERDELRAAATSLCLRVSQAALTASKGAGFVVGHPAERAVREAMLFLVWSCPRQVAGAVLCDLAGLPAAP